MLIVLVYSKVNWTGMEVVCVVCVSLTIKYTHTYICCWTDEVSAWVVVRVILGRERQDRPAHTQLTSSLQQQKRERLRVRCECE